MPTYNPKTGILEETDMFGLASHPVLDENGQATRINPDTHVIEKQTTFHGWQAAVDSHGHQLRMDPDSKKVEQATWHGLWWNDHEKGSARPSGSSAPPPPPPPVPPSSSSASPYGDSSDDGSPMPHARGQGPSSWARSTSSAAPHAAAKKVVKGAGEGSGATVLGIVAGVAVVGLAAAMIAAATGPKEPRKPPSSDGWRVLWVLVALISLMPICSGLGWTEASPYFSLEPLLWGIGILLVAVLFFFWTFLLDQTDMEEYQKRHAKWKIDYSAWEHRRDQAKVARKAAR